MHVAVCLGARVLYVQPARDTCLALGMCHVFEIERVDFSSSTLLTLTLSVTETHDLPVARLVAAPAPPNYPERKVGAERAVASISNSLGSRFCSSGMMSSSTFQSS